MLPAVMLDSRHVLRSAGRYLRAHPEELSRMVRSALGMRVGVPVAAFRWLAAEVLDEDKVQNLDIVPCPPGLRLAANVELMGTRVRVSAAIFVDRVELTADLAQLVLRLEDVSMTPLEPATRTHITALLNSGALDLSRPGSLMAELPHVPALVKEARDKYITLDLLAVPRLAHNPNVRRALALVSSWMTLDGIETESDHLDLHFRPLPQGFSAAFDAVQEHVVEPSLRRATQAIPARFRGGIEQGVRYMLGRVTGQDNGEPSSSSNRAGSSGGHDHGYDPDHNHAHARAQTGPGHASAGSKQPGHVRNGRSLRQTVFSWF